MTKILVLYYSSYGHIETMATAVADGAREAGAEVTIKRVPELVPGEVAKRAGFKLDQTGGLWVTDKLVGKVGSVFCSTGTQHGGQETTITSFHTTLFHLGFVVVGVPYSCKDILTMDEITGGSPYGASTLASADGKSRRVSSNELKIARFQGRHVADIMLTLVAGRAAALPTSSRAPATREDGA